MYIFFIIFSFFLIDYQFDKAVNLFCKLIILSLAFFGSTRADFFASSNLKKRIKFHLNFGNKYKKFALLLRFTFQMCWRESFRQEPQSLRRPMLETQGNHWCSAAPCLLDDNWQTTWVFHRSSSFPRSACSSSTAVHTGPRLTQPEQPLVWQVRSSACGLALREVCRRRLYSSLSQLFAQALEMRLQLRCFRPKLRLLFWVLSTAPDWFPPLCPGLHYRLTFSIDLFFNSKLNTNINILDINLKMMKF